MTRLILGNVTFEHFEIPEQLDGIGGIHQLAVHNLIGPGKVVQALGPKPHSLSWSAAFVWEGATDRVRQLDQYRISAERIRFSWDVFAYEVIIREFEAKPRHKRDIPYTIHLEVVEDLTAVPGPATRASSDEGVLNAFNRGDEALESLDSNANFEQVALPNNNLLPEDQTTIATYLGDDIEIQPPVEVLGANG